MKENFPELIIGLRGWQYPQWLGGFYPEDMPKEWWFSYYSNEFRSVLLPYKYLVDNDEDTVQDWLDDSDNSFKFYLELPASVSWDEVKTRIEILKPQIAGIEIKIQSDKKYNLHLMESLLQNLVKVAPLITDWDKTTNEMEPLLRSVQTGCYWAQVPQESRFCQGPVAIVETESSTINDPKQIRKFLESCLSAQGPSTIGVFFSGLSPNYNQARNAAMIYQLLV